MLTWKNAIKNSLILNKPTHGSSLVVEDGKKGKEYKSHAPSPFCKSKFQAHELLPNTISWVNIYHRMKLLMHPLAGVQRCQSHKLLRNVTAVGI